MIDYRAWIAAAILIAAAGGAYVLYITRPKATYTARSLTAPPHTSLMDTKLLHVEGCQKNFIVKPGELVEPRVVPGAPIDQFRAVYGKESKQLDQQTFAWTPDAFTLTEADLGPQNPGNFVQLSLNQGHVVETLDDIELGIDSFGRILSKLRDLKIDSHQRVVKSPGSWTFILSFYSACGHKFRSEYSRTFPANPALDRLITPVAPAQDGQPAPWRSDVFMNKIVGEYRLVPSEGSDDSPQGDPAERQ